MYGIVDQPIHLARILDIGEMLSSPSFRNCSTILFSIMSEITIEYQVKVC